MINFIKVLLGLNGRSSASWTIKTNKLFIIIDFINWVTNYKKSHVIDITQLGLLIDVDRHDWTIDIQLGLLAYSVGVNITLTK